MSLIAKTRRVFLYATALLVAAEMVPAQQNILGTNLIVNGGAEAGPAGTNYNTLVAIPGWSVSGPITVIPYGVGNFIDLNYAIPPDHGFQYFIGTGYIPRSSLTQTIDVSAAASQINTGNIKFTAAAYLGCIVSPAGDGGNSEMQVAFQNAKGQTFSTATLGPQGVPGSGVNLQQQIGLVPVGTTTITVTLSMVAGNSGLAAADSLSLVLSVLSTAPGSVLGTNLVVNGGLEAGPNNPPSQSVAPYIPGWSSAGYPSVAPYGGAGWIQPTDPGPADRGVSLFGGSRNGAVCYQDIDVSGGSSLIDAGQVSYQVSAWLGALASTPNPTLTYTFYDWSGKQLAATVQLTHSTLGNTGLFETSSSGTLPAGTRRVNITITFPVGGSLADDIAFTLAAPSGPPVITPGGIVSAGAFGGFTSVSPGSWIEIYGTDLAASTGGWGGANFTNGVAPTSLGGVSVSVGGKAAFIDYVSPGQIDALISSDAPAGAMPITVTNANGTSDKFWLIVNPIQPGLLAPASFLIGGKQYVAALFPDGQTFALPAGAIPGVLSRPAKAGDTVTLYGVGFGPVSGGLTAGTLVTQQNSLSLPLQIVFDNSAATVPYSGLAPSFTGLYQFNVTVPTVTTNNAMPISFTLGGTKGLQTLFIAIQ